LIGKYLEPENMGPSIRDYKTVYFPDYV